MRKKSHILLARYLADQMQTTASLQSHRKAFCLGSILPDIKPSFITRRHEFYGTFEDVKNRMKELADIRPDESNQRVYWRRFGEVIHYMADYFTFPHNKTYTGSFSQHNHYEKVLKNRLKECIQQGEAYAYLEPAIRFADFSTLIDYIEATHEKYLNKLRSVEEDIRAYVIWGLGSFARVSGDQMLLFVCIMAVLLPLSFLLIKTMNLLLLGDGYARNLGLNIKRARLLVISCSGVLVAIVTAYCGPIMFIGLAVPHLCRAIFHTSDHRILMPATLLVGAALALVCNLIARMPGFEGALPVNSVTALVGAPVVASVLFRKRKGELNE